jgi:hypothetical protein
MIETTTTTSDALELLQRVAGTAQTERDARSARASMRGQVARLESELAALFCSSPLPPPAGVADGTAEARILTLGELEELRDHLVERLATERRARDRRSADQERARRRLEEITLHPDRYRWTTISSEELGEPSCRRWEVVPRLGILGMLLNWWRVRISSGCPLATGRGSAAPG